MNIFLLLNITRPDRQVSDYGGDAVQESFTGIFAFFDSFRCILIGLFTGVWC